MSSTAEGRTRGSGRLPTVRRRLLLMAFSLVAPALVLMVMLAVAAFGQSQRRFEAQLSATTRALALATERQLDQGQGVLQGLAVSPALASGDLKAFETQARRAVAGRSGWIVLIGPAGQRLNTLVAPGAPLPRGLLPAARWADIRAGRTSVSNLFIGDQTHEPTVAIDTAVLVDGELNDLAYIERPSAFASLFQAQRLPDSWTGAIVDRNAALVARSHDQARMLGRHASPDMQAAMARAPEGLVRTHTLEGTPTLSAYSRSPTYGWTFIVGVPRTELDYAVAGSILLFASAAAALIAIGAGAAILFARPISRDVRALSADARAVIARRDMAPEPHSLLEAEEVRRSLDAAAAQLASQDADVARAAARQQLMINELNHRVKNTLATVQSLARHSLRGADRDQLASFTERLMALARAHDLLTRKVWEGAGLQEILRQTLEPHGDRARIGGPPVELTPNTAVSLSMVFHELATNAAKYGALSVEAGVLEVSWRAGAGSDRMEIAWVERGGPPVTPPTTSGFGSRLIATSLKGELGGDAVFDYRPEGLVCLLTLRLEPAP